MSFEALPDRVNNLFVSVDVPDDFVGIFRTEHGLVPTPALADLLEQRAQDFENGMALVQCVELENCMLIGIHPAVEIDGPLASEVYRAIVD